MGSNVDTPPQNSGLHAQANESHSSIVRGLILSLAGYAAYSTHDALVKALSDYSVFQILFFAMLFAYVPFSVTRIASAKPLSLMPVHPKMVILRATLNVLSLSFAFSAFVTLPLVEVYVLLFCTPLIISVMAIVFLNERIVLVRWVLIFLGMVGVIVVLRPSIETLEVGHIFAFSAACCSAASAIIARKIGAQENMATMILFPLIATILVTGCALYFVYKPMPIEHLGIMFLIGALGLLGQYCNLSGFRHAPAAYVAPMQYSQIIWAIFFGYVFFNEPIDQWIIIGSLITIASGVGMILRERKVSKVQANLNTRNGRAVVAPLMKTREADKSKHATSNQ